MLLNNTAVGDPGEGNIAVNPRAYASIYQGTWAENNDAYRPYNTFYNSTKATGDGLILPVFLAVGTYSLRVTVMQDTDGGYLKYAIPSGTAGSNLGECYAAAAGAAVLTVTGISITASGLTNVLLYTDSKNGASTAYALYLKDITFWRTA